MLVSLITGTRGAQTVHKGNELQFICEASDRPEPNITWTKEKTVSQGKAGVWQEGQVVTLTKISNNDSRVFNCAAYSGFGKPDSEAVYMNVTFEYIIYTLKKTLIIVLNGNALSIYLLCFNTYSHSLLLMLMAW